MQHLITIMMGKIWCNIGDDIPPPTLAHPSYSPDIAPCDYWLFAHVKEYLQSKQFESDDVNTAVTASLQHLNKDVYRAAHDIPHRWEKCVDSAVDYTE